jgi:hypothetical protein
MQTIEQRIAAIVDGHVRQIGQIGAAFHASCSCRWYDQGRQTTREAVEAFNAHAAKAFVDELGLTEFTCENQRWWATRIETITTRHNRALAAVGDPHRRGPVQRRAVFAARRPVHRRITRPARPRDVTTTMA